jgi:hypothetical protein
VTLCAWIGLAGLAWGQPPGDCRPNALNIPGAPYPCVFPDNRVMFRVAAPDAQKVRVRVGKGFDMTKEADGLWYATTMNLVQVAWEGGDVRRFHELLAQLVRHEDDEFVLFHPRDQRRIFGGRQRAD